MITNQETSNDLRIFSRSKIKKYLIVFASFLGIMGVYTLISGALGGLIGMGQNGPGANQTPPQGNGNDIMNPPTGTPGNPPTGAPGAPPTGSPTGNQMDGAGMGMGNFNSLWPMWGQVVQPTWTAILLAIAIFTIFGLIVYQFFGKDSKVTIPILVITGIITIIATNFIQGWDSVVNSIGNGSEILSDAIKITNVLEFISTFEQLQPNLSIHAQTQPPGGVLAIYVLYLIFQDAGYIALALCIITAFGSAYFINGIFKHFFEEETRKYGVLLYLILPAVQVYYLANLYAIVAMFAFGAIYFYFKDRTKTSLIATFICLFCLTFLSYLSVWIFLFFALYEIIHAWRTDQFNWKTIKTEKIGNTIKTLVKIYGRLIVMVIGIVGIYFGLYLALGYNYINSFLYASALENPNGFMLTTDPVNYFVTRFENLLDILFFFGPVLAVLCWEGIKGIKEDAKVSQLQSVPSDPSEAINQSEISHETNLTKKDVQTSTLPTQNTINKFEFVMSGLMALVLLFLTGAAKKGETARICLFILPFILIPVLYHLAKAQISRKEKVILILVVIAQTIVMQLFTTYIW